MKVHGIAGSNSMANELDSTNSGQGAADLSFQSLLGELVSEQLSASGSSAAQSNSKTSGAADPTASVGCASPSGGAPTLTRVPDQDSTFATDMDAIEAQYGGHATQSQILAGLYAMDPEGMKHFSSHSV